ncbi:concanavalin A-like lectin/glucanase superfamily protein [Archangium gephyra]|uniref:Concanavalin A-like lectin/glucanase superfamily protein n=1 Tax=Archangium gephyra TaxID=48 RepID=A0AAC8QDN4_9BACT|nr:LamG domain-containing protein [Archangium gephyra]AKJ05409.1 Hypothetical protein AA314_07035 [Archangium gephyra]REG36093.1 concanavalin A-like lectin/glucanase superfamily protein [Archangium gephyra]
MMQQKNSRKQRGTSIQLGRAVCGLGLLGALGAGCGTSTLPAPRAEESVAEVERGLILPTPVGHWAFEDTAGSLTVRDSSGNGADGTKYNGVTSNFSGRIGQSLIFDGVDDRVEVPDRPSFHFTTAMTASAWVRHPNADGPNTIVGKWYGPDAYLLRVEDGQYVFTVALDDGTTRDVYAPATANVWTHVAGVFNGADIKLYVNGTLMATTPAVGTLSDSTQPVIIGNQPEWNAFEGQIDEVQLYDTALGGQKIRHLAQAMKRRLAILRYDPIAPSGQRLTQVLGWPDEQAYSRQLVGKLQQVTLGSVNYQVVEDVAINAFPLKRDGFRYNYETYMACRANSANCHRPDDASYAAMMADYQAARASSLCDKIASGAIDEVWVWGGDYFGFDEFAFKIPNDAPAFAPQPYNYWIYEGRKKDLPVCGRTYFVMGFNPDVGFDNMMHSYGHRIESALTLSPAAKGLWTRCDPNSPWTKFICIDKDSPGQSSCGDVHFPANGRSDYDYGNITPVASSGAQWETYPVTDLTQKQSVSCSTWGCSQEGYLTYWMSHLPKHPGNSTTELYNWWKYVVNYDVVYQPLP